MKKNIPIFLFLFSFSLTSFAQKWQSIGLTENANAGAIGFNKAGHFIVKLHNLDKYMVTKDNGTTWENISKDSIDVGPKAQIGSDGTIYNFSLNNINKYDSVAKKFVLAFGFLSNETIVAMKVANGKIYVLGHNTFIVFDDKTYSPLGSYYSPQWAFGGDIFIGKNNINIMYRVDNFSGVSQWFMFDDNLVSIKQSPSLPSNFLFLASGKFIFSDGASVKISSDTTNWVDAINGNIHGFNVLNDNTIVVMTDKATFHSKDEGATWKNYPHSIKTLYYSFTRSSNSVMLNSSVCDGSQGYFESFDYGATWQKKLHNLDKHIVSDIYFSPTNDLFYRSCGTVFLTKKGSTATAETFPNIDSVNITDKTMFLKSGKWVNNFNGFYYISDDKGKTWKKINVPQAVQIPFTYLFFSQNDEFFVFDGYDYNISSDYGATWQKFTINSYMGLNELPQRANSLVLRKGNFLYYEAEGDAYYKYDLTPGTGELWTIFYFTTDKKVYDSFHFINEQRYCFVMRWNWDKQYYIYLSNDLDKTTSEYRPLPRPTIAPRQFLIDKNGVFILLYDDDIMCSLNEGLTWFSIKGNLKSKSLIVLAIDKEEYLYVAVGEGQIYKTSEKLPQKHLLSGHVFLDENADCSKTEPNLNNIKVVLTGTSNNIIETNSNGDFSFPVIKGNYKMTLDYNPFIFKQNCLDLNNIVIKDSIAPNELRIPLQVIKSCESAQVTIATPALRRCFLNYSKIEICNHGSLPIKNAVIDVKLDSLFEFDYVNLPFSTKNDGTMAIKIPEIPQGICYSFNIRYNVSCDSKLSQTHCIKANLNLKTPCNDTISLQKRSYQECRQNTGAYDPNDKIVYVNNNEANKKARAGDKIDYLIRFQNTGTDTAVNIVVKDTLSALLDWNSIEMGTSSHRYDWEVKNDILTTTFLRIMLPDSNKSKANSQGFFKFRIKPKPTVTYKDLLRNRAGIYFDFNEPVMTDYAILNDKSSKISYFDEKNIDFECFPNPFFEKITLRWNTIVTTEKTEYTISDISGKTLKRGFFNGEQATLDFKNFQSGIYFIQLKNKDFFGVKKIIKN